MKKAMIAPIIFAVLTMVCVLGYAAVFLWIPLPLVVKVGIALVVLALIVAMAYVVVERSREIDKEEYDDLSKY
jgi:heme A synthase